MLAITSYGHEIIVVSTARGHTLKIRHILLRLSDIYKGVVAGTAAAGVGVVAIEGLFPGGGLLAGLAEGFFDLGVLSCCCCCCFCCCRHLALRFLNHTCRHVGIICLYGYVIRDASTQLLHILS